MPKSEYPEMRTSGPNLELRVFNTTLLTFPLLPCSLGIHIRVALLRSQPRGSPQRIDLTMDPPRGIHLLPKIAGTDPLMPPSTINVVIYQS